MLGYDIQFDQGAISQRNTPENLLFFENQVRGCAQLYQNARELWGAMRAGYFFVDFLRGGCYFFDFAFLFLLLLFLVSFFGFSCFFCFRICFCCLFFVCCRSFAVCCFFAVAAFAAFLLLMCVLL